MAWQIAAAMAMQALAARRRNKKAQLNADTAHQREVKDLIAAGLNPILSANRGAPMPQLENPLAGATEAASSARGLSQLKKVQKAQAAHITAQAGVATAQQAGVAAQTRKTDAEARILEIKAMAADAVTGTVDKINPMRYLENLFGSTGKAQEILAKGLQRLQGSPNINQRKKKKAKGPRIEFDSSWQKNPDRRKEHYFRYNPQDRNRWWPGRRYRAEPWRGD